MAQRLEDLHVDEVSLVKRGANRRRFLLAKSGEVEFDETIAKILDAPARNETAIVEAFQKAGGDEELLHAVAAFARIREALPASVLKAMNTNDDDEVEDKPGEDDDESLQKAEHAVYKRAFTAEQRKDLAGKGWALDNGSYPIETKADIGPAVTLAQSGHGDAAAAKALIKRRAGQLDATDLLPDDWKVNKEDGMSETAQAVPVKKDDGTWDLSAVPEDQRPAIEAVIKAADDEKAEAVKKAEEEATRAENAERIAKSVQEKIEKAEYVKKAEGYDNLAKSADDIGLLLYDISKAEEGKHLPEGTVAKLDELLAGANEAAADVFKTAGRIGHSTGGSDAESKIDAAAAEIRKADPSLTKSQAVAKALENDPSLYDQYRLEA